MRFNLPKQYRHFQRYREITQVLLRNGLGFIIDWLDLGKFLPFKERFNTDDTNLNRKAIASRLKNVLQELGPTYIKLGQLLGTRADILAPPYIKELRKLQDRIPSVPFSKIEPILQNELGKNYETFFSQINKNPRAAASIAQIHHAVLKDGTDVILKIQRPGIKRKIDVDLEILSNIANVAEERNIYSEFLKPTKLLEEFKESLSKELDFNMEVSNIERFRNNFENNSHIIVPEIYKELSSKKLIVMEEIKGVKLRDIDNYPGQINRGAVAALGAKALMKQVLIDGFFHADPHPGNIFVLNEDCLAYIDFGLIGQLTTEVQDYLDFLFLGLLKQNVNIIVDSLTEIGVTPREINMRKFKLDIKDLLNRYYGRDLSDIDFMAVLDDFQRIIYKYHIRMPEDFFLLGRAIAVSEGVGYMIDPDFNLVKVGNDFLIDLLKDRVNPEKVANRALNNFWKAHTTARDLPQTLGSILEKLANDDFTIKFKHMNLDDLINRLDIISNRLSISLIITALIIGSTMILQTEMHPMILDIPVLGFVGYIIAGIFGFWLVIDILRSGRY